MGHHIEDAFMFLSTVLLLLESHGAGFLKAVDLKSAWEQGLALSDAGGGPGEVAEEQSDVSSWWEHHSDAQG